MNWHGHARRILTIPATCSASERAVLIARWLAKHDCDLLFAQNPPAVLSAVGRLRRQRRITVAALGTTNDDQFSYLDEHPEVVGSAAVELLAGMMYYHETGIPEHPRTTMIDGELRLDRLTTRLLQPGAAT